MIKNIMRILHQFTRNRCLVRVLKFATVIVIFQVVKNFIVIENDLPEAGYLVQTPGCWIADMDPYDVSVKHFFKKSDRMDCGPRPLVQSNQTSIWIDLDVLVDYEVNKLSELSCCYNGFFGTGRTLYYYNDCIKFKESANVYHEFIKVNCTLLKLNKTYIDYHAFIVPKYKETVSSEKITQDDLSVLLLGVDSLSRLNFIRQMPITKSFVDSVGAIEILGYTKVDDNSFPNLMPILTGHSVKEIKQICWKNSTDYFDDCPYIWKNFSAKNYYTIFAEDIHIFETFTFNKKGFKVAPTDYFALPYIAANEDNIGHTKLLNTYYCYGSRFGTELLLDYAFKFIENMTLSNKKFMGYFWENTLTHDFVNNLPNNDEIFHQFFLKINSLGVLNKTAIFLLSDHGMRFGKIVKTHQGRLESRLPLLYILLPKWFHNKYKNAVKNIRKNARVLTTHFDLHETLKDLLDMDSIKDENLEKRKSGNLNKRGVSLFLPISPERSCESAELEPMWCTCNRHTNLSVDSSPVKQGASLVVRYINTLLENEKKCSQLKLKTIFRALKYEVQNTTSSYFDLIIALVTVPGSGEFEAVVRYFYETYELLIMNKIIRTNLYGSQSKCISDRELEPFCYCTNLLKKKKKVPSKEDKSE